MTRTVRGPPTVVSARSKKGNREVESRLGKLGIRAVGVETIRFLPPADWGEVDAALKSIERFDWVVFTSPRAVKAFVERVDKLGVTLVGHRPKIAAVGSATADSLRRSRLEADFVPGEYLTSALGDALPGRRGARVLLLRADIADGGLADSLVGRGFETTDLAIYGTRSVAGRVSRRDVNEGDVVVFASPSEVRGFSERVPPGAFRTLAARAAAACIGPVTARAARSAGFKTVIEPKVHTMDALVERIREYCDND
jgi:uroporphyrinogen-III synthase